MKNILIVFGTRPEAIKMCPLVNEFKKKTVFNTKVLVTGQHNKMLKQVLDVFKVVPDVNLSIMREGQTLFTITSNILLKIQKHLIELSPDLILVHGDTTTTFATSLAAYYLKIPVGHVEAGLRTNNIYSPFPEEFNRSAVSIIAKYHFAPTNLSKWNLLNEGKNPDSIYVTGNTVIDALKTTVYNDYKHEVLEWIGTSKMILVTAHRRENLGVNMQNMFKAILRICNEHKDIKIIYPVHLNPQVRDVAYKILGENERIKLIEPLNVIDFHNFMSKAYIILTDSGGVQEEAPTFGVPVLVMRETTERPEGIESGTLKLVGTTEDGIYQSFNQLLLDELEYEKMHKSANPYGDGKASLRIVQIIEDDLLKEKK